MPQSELFLPALLDSFLAHLSVERGLSTNTCEAYRGDGKRFIKSLPEELMRKPQAIEERHIIEFLVDERKGGRSVRSMRRTVSALRTFFKFLSRNGACDDDPTRYLEMPRDWERLPEVLEVEQMRRLLEAVAENPSRYPLRDRALLELMYATGMRVSEAIQLRTDSLRADLGILRCFGKGSRERIVPVNQSALEAVAEYVEKERPRLAKQTGSDLLFLSRAGNPLGREVVSELLRKYALKAGIPNHVTPHTLRHSFATHLLRRGADLRVVQEILGHVKVETTEIYTHLDRTDLKKAHQKFHPRG